MKKILFFFFLFILVFANSSQELLNKALEFYEKNDYENAKTYAKRACNLGKGDGCYLLGKIYLEQSDFNKSKEYFNKAIKLKSYIGYIGLGDIFFLKERSIDNLQKASKFYKKACDLGIKSGCESYRNSQLIIYLLLDPFEKGLKALKKEKYKEAIKFFKKSCDEGDIRGCKELRKFFEGIYYKVPSNTFSLQTRIKYYTKACELGDAQSCLVWSSHFSSKKDLKKSLKFMKKACEFKFREACEGIGEFYLEYKKDPEIALEYYLKGYFPYTNKKNIYKISRLLKKHPNILKKLQEKCNKNNSNACKIMSILYLNGAIKKDLQKAKEYAIKACKLGNAKGCNIAMVFSMLDNNFQKTLEYAKKACSIGDRSNFIFPDGCWFIASYYIKKEDFNKSLEYIKKSVKINPLWGYGLLGSYYFEFKDLKSAIKGFKYMVNSCELGNSASCYTLGNIYNNMLQKYSMAEKYYEKACELGSNKACKIYFKIFLEKNKNLINKLQKGGN